MPIHASLTADEEREVVALTRELVRIRSVNPPGAEAAVVALLARRAEAWGLECRLDSAADDRPNLIVRLPGAGERPALLLSGHTDTVPPGEAPWDHEPFSGDLVDGAIWGRGAVDMKAGVAAMLVAMAALARRGWRPRGDLRLVGTVDEEVSCLGARHLLRTGGLEGVGWIVIGEPTNLDVVPAHRGAIWLELVAHGKTAHGSMPHLGVNAILHLAELLRWLVERRFPYTPHPLLAPPTINVGTIAGGVKTNVVPDRCVATVDLRTVPGQDHAAIVEEVRDLAAELVSTAPGLRIDVNVGNDMPPLETAADHPLVQTMQAAVAEVLGVSPPIRGAPYYTDGGVWVQTGIPIVIFGPGDDRLAHQPNERVESTQVVQAVRAYLALAEHLLG
jgi:succinyl-diaminopimelate desuccinylase